MPTDSRTKAPLPVWHGPRPRCARAARVWAADGIGAAVQCRVCEWSAGAFRRGLSAARTKAATEAQPRQTGRRSG